jgi:hypothetical protein
MERVTPVYLIWTLRTLCLTALLMGACVSFVWLALLFTDHPDERYATADIIETLVVSGIFLNIAYVWVFVRARHAEQLAVLLLSIPIAVLAHCVTVVFIAHHAHRWLFETMNILLACAIGYGVLAIGNAYGRFRSTV